MIVNRHLLALAILAAVASAFSQISNKADRPLIKTQGQAIQYLKGHGYKIQDLEQNSGTISKDGRWALFAFGESSDGGGRKWAGLLLDACFLVPHPIDQKAVQSWFTAHKASDIKLVARVDDVVKLEDWSVEFDGKADSRGQIDRFLRISAELGRNFRAEQKASYADYGRMPEGSVRLYALSFDELVTLSKAWHWEIQGGAADLGMVFGEGRIRGVKVHVTTGYDPTEHFSVSADVATDKGVDAAKVAERLRKGKSRPWSKEAASTVESGRPFESFAEGAGKSGYYSMLTFKFNGMTVGGFRRTIEDFAKRCKGLPHR